MMLFCQTMIFPVFFVFWSAQFDGWVSINLLNFAPTGKSYLEKRDGSFVDQKIFYRMNLSLSLLCVGKCPKKRKTFSTVYYTSLQLNFLCEVTTNSLIPCTTFSIFFLNIHNNAQLTTFDEKKNHEHY
jgi:hypothetical protein